MIEGQCGPKRRVKLSGMKFQQSAGASAIDECWFWFVFDWWVMGASSANGSAKRREREEERLIDS